MSKKKSILCNCDIDRAINFIARHIKDSEERQEILGVRSYRIVMSDMFFHFVNAKARGLYMERQKKARGGRVELTFDTNDATYKFVCDCDHKAKKVVVA